ncbi:alpha/beta hydrolase [Chitinophaga lutea]
MDLKCIATVIFLLLAMNAATARQQVMPLYNGAAPGSEKWTWQEKTFKDQHATVIYDVAQPTLEVFYPPDSIRNGTAVVVCPGGGFCLLEIEGEGRNIARRLSDKGITAFVLKYRVMKSKTDNPQKEMFAKAMDTQKLAKDADTVIQMATEDIMTAMARIKAEADQLRINAEKVGVLGFSAGGTLATALAYNYSTQTRPAFVAVLYPWTAPVNKQQIQVNAPPLFIAAASDDQLGFYSGSTELYLDWVGQKHSAELHLYATGGHGFVAFPSGGPSDGWSDRFMEWLHAGKFVPGLGN